MRFTRPLDHVLGTKSRVAVLRYLSLNGLELNGRQIARALGLSPKPLNRTLADLAAEGLLVQRNVGSAYLFRANLDNPLVSDVLMPLFQKERNLLRDALDEVLDGLKEGIFTAILYGSVSRGEDRPSSDVDIIVVTDHMEEVKEALEERAVAFLERYGNILSAQVISPDELRRRYWDGDDFVREVLAEGQVIVGRSPWELIRNAA